jgi:hypothetical protein
MLLQFFIPWDPIEKDMMEWVGNSTQVVGVFALAIGLASLIHMHGNKIIRNAPGWGFSIVTLVCLVIVLTIGLFPQLKKPVSYTDAPKNNASFDLASLSLHTPAVAEVDPETKLTNRYVSTTHTLCGFQPTREYTTYTNAMGRVYNLEVAEIPMFNWIFQYIFFALSSTTFSLLAFYMMTATYRAVRVKSWESGLLLLAAIIVLIGQVPMDQIPIVGPIISGGELKGISTFEYLKGLILQFPNTAAKRGIIIGIALGSLATGIKIIFGIEKPYMGGRG